MARPRRLEPIVQIELQTVVIEVVAGIHADLVQEVRRVQHPVPDGNISGPEHEALGIRATGSEVRVDELAEESVLFNALIGGAQLPAPVVACATEQEAEAVCLVEV